ncbi:ABC transporter permease [Paenibacillus macquariensis]|uniref:Monosaccharide ABC transporter membrane protein, CUT2 family n=1 Tax=Paenibacillus macquariensis TaxID=948756 RepID=A0ABY1K7U9_9BACL|nr:ABC transporter permease [Paenibacillus macquariensis]MEC0091167.1 ABC transporter permease [Paenibacillus macquariensis]OAB33650.1 ribose ABC transporter permease [Paenibacillus macquariensis subsp. macquariensis]SIR38488.1 monosaccharide ABC transporter membrane protein, CUT2 family [Paenibacillus macquariensis]
MSNAVTELNKTQTKERNWLKYLWEQYSVLFALIVLIIFASILSEHFLSITNITNVLRQVSIVGILSLGMTFVIILGGIDLSVGSVLAMSGTVVMASQVTYSTSIPVSIVLGLMCGLIIGLINGLMVTYGKITAFIATLAMMTIARSIALFYADAGAISGLNSTYAKIGNAYVFGIPIPVIIFVIMVFLSYIVLEKTVYGRHVYAVGGNAQAARLSAISVFRVTIISYMICGFTAAVGSIIETSRLNSISTSTSGNMYELDAIAAVIIGGASLSGGRGRILGTLFGVLILGVLSNTMNLLNISPYLQGVVKGLIIVAAVLLQKRD